MSKVEFAVPRIPSADVQEVLITVRHGIYVTTTVTWRDNRQEDFFALVRYNTLGRQIETDGTKLTEFIARTGIDATMLRLYIKMALRGIH